MAYLSIDTNTTELKYQQLTQLEGREYLLRFWWSTREAAWYLGIYDQDGNPIATFIKIVVNWSLLHRKRDPRLPPGILMAIDTTGAEKDMASPDELGGRVRLVYITSDDPDVAGAA